MNFMEKENIKKAIALAKKLRTELGVEGVGVDLNYIVNNINSLGYVKPGDHLIVNETDLTPLGKELERSISGFIKRIDENVYIGIEKSEYPYRKRFTLAHELGHYLLHQQNDSEFEQIDFRDGIDFNGQGSYSSDPHEQEANAFAAELLMPEEQVKEYLKEYGSYELMAYLFGVSYAAMKIRLKNLGLRR